jgi:hypothetical protein
MQEQGEWVVVDVTGYPFKDFHHFKDQFNWLLRHYGSPTYTQKQLKVFGGNVAYISIIDGEDPLLDDPIYRFGFRETPDAVNFYLSFV